jgi:uncharacterized protein (DUF1499 family)
MRILRRVGIVLAVLVGLRIALAFVWPTINDVTTGATPEYPDLKPQVFARSYDEVFDAAAATARAQERWEVTKEERAAGVIEAVATTGLWRFKDDVTITVQSEGAQVTVGMRSRSRIGKGDLGANARRIRDYQAALAARLSSTPQ